MARATVRCETHGDTPYEGHVICRQCKTSYTTHDESLMTHAPPRCRGCGSRLMPVPGADRTKHKFTFMPSCAECYRGAPMSMKGKHESGDARCPGEACPFHGQQLRKMKKRALQASRQRSTLPAPSEEPAIEIQVPGMLGMQTIEVERG